MGLDSADTTTRTYIASEATACDHFAQPIDVCPVWECRCNLLPEANSGLQSISRIKVIYLEILILKYQWEPIKRCPGIGGIERRYRRRRKRCDSGIKYGDSIRVRVTGDPESER